MVQIKNGNIPLALPTSAHLFGHHSLSPVRENFEKVTFCRTMALGAEVYASETEEKVFPHTCKSRACPSCGHCATILWQRKQWAALPNVRYVGINFTMPDVLWPIFRSNRHLLHDLPTLAASVIQQYLKLKHRVRGLVMVVPHTFGPRLNFHPRLHTLVSAGGLREGENRWVNVAEFDKNALMQMWKFAVITFLRHALFVQVLQSKLSDRRLEQILTQQYERWWNMHVARFASKYHFVRYAGRYIRRPPIAQHRFTKIGDGQVQFQRNDLKLKKWVSTDYSIEDFLHALADHIPHRYRHAIRYFGLLAPGAKGRTGLALFAVLRQPKRPRPLRLSWATSIKRDFNRDPLLDSSGQRNALGAPSRAEERLKHLTSKPALRVSKLVLAGRMTRSRFRGLAGSFWGSLAVKRPFFIHCARQHADSSFCFPYTSSTSITWERTASRSETIAPYSLMGCADLSW